MIMLFWLLVMALVWWAWRRSRSTQAQAPAAPNTPQDMVSCSHCGIHLPRDEAVAGTLGLYCSTTHRSAANDRNPG